MEEKTIYGIDKDNAQKSGRKDFKGIGTQNAFEPPNPASVVEEKDTIYNKNTIGWSSSENNKTYLKANPGYTPRQPGSVVEEKDQDRILTDDNRFLSKSAYKGSVKETMKDYKNRMGSLFDPKQPTSVVEEMDEFGWSVGNLPKENRGKEGFEPRQPASVVEENAESNKVWGYDKPDTFKISKDGTNQNFEPPNPVSVVIPAEDEPVSMFESTKVFIGKRHHQTEKPQDILEFFIKYWTDEGDTILDPTMGSGSTGVACNKLKRNFIGFELDETIFKVAEKRVNTKVI